MNTRLEVSDRDISEAEMDQNVASIVQDAQTQTDYRLYVYFGGRHRSHIKAIAASYESDVKLLRRPGPWWINWLVFFIAGHVALVRLRRPEVLPDFYEAELKDEFICAIVGFASRHEAAFLNACRQSGFIDFDPDIFANDPTAFILQFVYLDRQPEMVRWVHKGGAVPIDFN
jgi:hypothetical protein